jgi:hypothetical protein
MRFGTDDEPEAADRCDWHHPTKARNRHPVLDEIQKENENKTWNKEAKPRGFSWKKTPKKHRTADDV